MALVVLLGLVLATPAQAVQNAERNAALDYLRVILMSQHKDVLFDDVRAVHDQLHPKPDSEFKPVDSPETLVPGGPLAEALEGEERLLSEIERASLVERCDFQVRYEDGHDMMVPHVGSMRMLGLLLVVDARRLALDDQPQAAAQRLSAAFRLARHLSSDRILIVSIPASHVGEMAVREAQWLLDITKDDAEVVNVIRTALGRLPAEDPYNFEAALRTERDMMARIGTAFEGGEAALRFLEAFARDAEFESADEASMIWKAMGGGEFSEDVDRCIRAYEEVFNAWDSQDPQAALEDIAADVENGEHGVVAAMLMPNLERIQRTDASVRESLEDLRSRIQADR